MPCQGADKRGKGGKDCPSHQQVDGRVETAGGFHPQEFEDQSGQCEEPLTGKKRPSPWAPEADHAKGGIGGGDEHKDHDVVDAAEEQQGFFVPVPGVVEGAGEVKQEHGNGEDAKAEAGEFAHRRIAAGEEEGDSGEGEECAGEVAEATELIPEYHTLTRGLILTTGTPWAFSFNSSGNDSNFNCRPRSLAASAKRL